MTVRTIDEIFRDYNIDGVPASGPFHPHKPDLRDTFKKLLEGISTFPDNRVIRLNNANEGSPNEIIVTASVDIPAAAYQVLYILNVTQENTGPVKVTGAINRDLVTNINQPITAGYLTPGMALLCIDTGTELRLLSYGDAEAILTAAEEAAARAEAAAAGLNLPTIQPGDAGKSLIVNPDEDGYELGSSNAGEYESRAKVEQTNVPETASFLRTAGYYAPGDGGGALYKRVATKPSHAGKIQSLDGAWWELAETVPNVKMFGARGNGEANDSPSFQAAYDFMKFKGGGAVKVTATPSYYRLIETVIFDNTTNFHLMGVGKPLIQDMSTDGSNTFNIGNGTHSQFQTLLSDLKIWGPENPQNGNALNCSYAGSLRLEGVNIYRHKLRGIAADNCWTLGAVGCSVVGCSEGQVILTGASGNGARWEDCTFNDTPAGKFAFHIAGTDGVANPENGPHFGTTLIACRFEFNEFGLFAQYARALNLLGNYFEFNSTNAFRIVQGCKGVIIHGNSIFTSPGLVLGADMVDIRGNQSEWDGNIEVGDSTNVSWGPNGVTNKPNSIFGTTQNMEYQAFPEWVPFSSTWISSGTQPTVGNGSLIFKYKRCGNTVQCVVTLTMGSTTTYGAIGYGFRLPFTVAAGAVQLGKAGYYDASSDGIVMQMTAMCEPGENYVSLRNDGGGVVGPTAPVTFASGDKIYASFTYECVDD